MLHAIPQQVIVGPRVFFEGIIPASFAEMMMASTPANAEPI
jgi:hypothetical protein